MRAAGRLVLALCLCAPGCTSRTIDLVCPWAPGGGTDAVSRFWAEALHQQLGQPCVVVNKTGGSGVAGHSFGARARPDGHTVTMITFELCTMHQMGLTDLTYRDFQPLIEINADPAAILVRKDAPWHTLREFLDHVRAHPGAVTMSGTALGGAWDLARRGLLLADGQAADAIRWIPESGAGPSLVKLLGGHIDAVCCSVPEAAASLEQLRVLAVMSDERLKRFPEVQTAKENGVDWTMVGFRGLAVPKATPQAVVDRLQSACEAIAKSDDFATFMEKTGYRVQRRSADEFLAFLEQEDQKWTDVIAKAGLSDRP